MLDADQIRKLVTLVGALDVGVLAIIDMTSPHISFNANLEKILGYSDGEIKGRPFSSLIGDVDRKDSEFFLFLDAIKENEILYPNNIREISLTSKDGANKEVRVLAEFFYDANFLSIFVFLMQSENEDPQKLRKIYQRVQALLIPGGKVGRSIRIFLLKISNQFSRAFTGATLTAVLGLFLTNSNGLIASFKAFGAARTYDDSKLTDQEITDFAATDAALNPTLIRLRDELSSIEPAIKSIAFYRIQDFPSFSSTPDSHTAIAKFGSDSNDKKGDGVVETFFEDQRLTVAQLSKLRDLECVWFDDLGYYPVKKASETPPEIFSGFICPTVFVNAATDTGIPRLELAALMAAAIETEGGSGGKKFDPTSYRGREVQTALIRRSPSVQPLSKK